MLNTSFISDHYRFIPTLLFYLLSLQCVVVRDPVLIVGRLLVTHAQVLIVGRLLVTHAQASRVT